MENFPCCRVRKSLVIRAQLYQINDVSETDFKFSEAHADVIT